MVTKLHHVVISSKISYVLAKIQMVTKPYAGNVQTDTCYVLAKIQMVTKRNWMC